MTSTDEHGGGKEFRVVGGGKKKDGQDGDGKKMKGCFQVVCVSFDTFDRSQMNKKISSRRKDANDKCTVSLTNDKCIFVVFAAAGATIAAAVAAAAAAVGGI
ncbi:hypothetical protein RUM44_005897 [Polyplax serrata]|uniref:Uncharacterized protein n=1 Tax=Polyplax serrata TaxID=468196 RepID=A0ABR1AYD5_POLSC